LIYCELTQQANDITIKILSDPSLSSNGKRFVSYLSLEELLLLLPKHDNNRPPGNLDLYGRLTSRDLKLPVVPSQCAESV